MKKTVLLILLVTLVVGGCSSMSATELQYGAAVP
jgi:PBP1b-binding outer membrane lipoprotein LpoB